MLRAGLDHESVKAALVTFEMNCSHSWLRGVPALDCIRVIHPVNGRKTGQLDEVSSGVCVKMDVCDGSGRYKPRPPLRFMGAPGGGWRDGHE
jgi:hypothetical protein